VVVVVHKTLVAVVQVDFVQLLLQQVVVEASNHL
jgi:hypothetical protein